ncbi:MAG: hypothetical protein DRO09_04275 [Thermoprotei archaeon]|nr:MAG: hypothetical protein DRO09_04275 [Thermoprotei archaeon]
MIGGRRKRYYEIKWIKGRPYVYRRARVRVDGKIRFISRYIGPATPELCKQLGIPLEKLERRRVVREQVREIRIELTQAEMIAFWALGVHKLTRKRWKPSKWGGLSWKDVKKAWESLKAKIPKPLKA